MEIYGIFRGGGTPYLARWTEDFDCGYETNWWYVIKDNVFAIETLPSKKRYEINKGFKFFDVKEFSLDIYRESVANVYCKAYEEYPQKYRPQFDYECFVKSKGQRENTKYYGAFEKQSGQLVAFAYLAFNGKYADFATEKCIPEFEKMNANAALIAGMLNLNSDFLANGGYICDGERNVLHETSFQSYLIKYFDFRKAYCSLHIVYKKLFGLFVKVLYPFRGMVLKFDNNSFCNKINGVLRMEGIVRERKRDG